jgi:DNA-binding XRE family transcriptional regulator
VRFNLEAARLNSGHSLRSGAKVIGITRETLERAERGQGVHPATAKKIADFYGVQVTDIWPVDQPGRSAAA